jgi:hypothetical protein
MFPSKWQIKAVARTESRSSEEYLKLTPFDYVRAESVSHAVRLLAEHQAGARIIAGGRFCQPSRLCGQVG